VESARRSSRSVVSRIDETSATGLGSVIEIDRARVEFKGARASVTPATASGEFNRAHVGVDGEFKTDSIGEFKRAHVSVGTARATAEYELHDVGEFKRAYGVELDRVTADIGEFKGAHVGTASMARAS
jgi:hypothetical protein